MISLRHATTADVPLLQSWDAMDHVKFATGNAAEDEIRDWLSEWFPPLKGWIELLVAELDGRPIGMIEIIDPAEDETHYWGICEAHLLALDIWIGEASDIGKGHGSEMMRQVIARCFAKPNVEALLLDPLVGNVKSHRFYERLGFDRIGRRMFGDDDCYIYRLARDKAKLQAK